MRVYFIALLIFPVAAVGSENFPAGECHYRLMAAPLFPASWSLVPEPPHRQVPQPIIHRGPASAHSPVPNVTRERFAAEASAAVAAMPSVFAPMAPTANLHRYDSRSPSEILAAGGFFPNPTKSRGQTLAQHAALKSQGSGNYVSFSTEHVEELARNQDFLPKRPEILNFASGRTVDTSPDEWANEERRDGHVFPPDAPDYPTSVIYVLYEYRVKAAVPAVRVIGGPHEYEREALVTHVSLEAGIEARRVEITVATPKTDNVINLSPVWLWRGDVLSSSRIAYGHWTQMTP